MRRRKDVSAMSDRTACSRTDGNTRSLCWPRWPRRISSGCSGRGTRWACFRSIRAAGIRQTAAAVEAFKWAVDETTRRYGRFDPQWGEVHRVRRGKVDVPVGGCSSDLGCFRVLTYRDDTDGKRIATGSDG